jgi:hypothetical protein
LFEHLELNFGLSGRFVVLRVYHMELTKEFQIIEENSEFRPPNAVVLEIVFLSMVVDLASFERS